MGNTPAEAFQFQLAIFWGVIFLPQPREDEVHPSLICVLNFICFLCWTSLRRNLGSPTFDEHILKNGDPIQPAVKTM